MPTTQLCSCSPLGQGIATALTDRIAQSDSEPCGATVDSQHGGWVSARAPAFSPAARDSGRGEPAAVGSRVRAVLTAAAATRARRGVVHPDAA